MGFSPQPHAQTTSIFGELDPTGAQRLDTQLSAVARLLRRMDATAAWEALRARALTLLADPAALARLQAQAQAAALTDPAPDPNGPGDSSDPSGSRSADHAGTSAAAARLATTVVHLHTDTQTWQSGDGLVEVEGYGWVPLASLTDMLDQTHIRVVAATTDLAHDDPTLAHPPGGHPPGGHPPGIPTAPGTIPTPPTNHARAPATTSRAATAPAASPAATAAPAPASATTPDPGPRPHVRLQPRLPVHPTPPAQDPHRLAPTPTLARRLPVALTHRRLLPRRPHGTTRLQPDAARPKTA